MSHTPHTRPHGISDEEPLSYEQAIDFVATHTIEAFRYMPVGGRVFCVQGKNKSSGKFRQANMTETTLQEVAIDLETRCKAGGATEDDRTACKLFHDVVKASIGRERQPHRPTLLQKAIPDYRGRPSNP